MIVFARGEVKTWRDLTPGALFGVSIEGETHSPASPSGWCMASCKKTSSLF